MNVLQTPGRRSLLLFVTLVLASSGISATEVDRKIHRFLYVVCPGIRDDLSVGGAGILVFNIDEGHTLVKRIETPASREAKPDNIKGVCACAATGKLYFTTRSKLYCVDLMSDKTLWETSPPEGTDRMSITPDGKLLYVPSFEKDTWNVIDAATGKLLTSIETKSGAHNTVVSRDGQRMYLGGLKSPILFVADTATHHIVQQVGPFAGAIRPFTVNGARTRAYICVNGLLGFEIGDLTSGKKLHRVEVSGYATGPVKRHGCPSHGIGLTPDEKEVWVVDAFNQRVHVFDNTAEPLKQTVSIALREQPGWVTFSLDGSLAYPSTGEVIDASTKRIITALADEAGRQVHSEKMVEIDFRDGRPVAVGDQFGVGRVTAWQANEAAKYLDERQTAWFAFDGRGEEPTRSACVSCHTVLPYALARPALRKLVGATPTEPEARLLAQTRMRVEHWPSLDTKAFGLYYSDSEQKKIQSWGTEAIVNAVILAFNDRYGGRASPSEPTKQAFANLWQTQLQTGAERGAWEWLDFSEPPWGSADSRYIGAALAAIAIGTAPSYDTADADVAARIEMLRNYLRDHFPKQDLHNQTWGVWAATQVDGILSKEQRQKLIDQLVEKQRDDGGWSLPSLGTWERKDGTRQETSSDGYATGLVLHVLQTAGVPTNDARIGRGLHWLTTHQAATGAWRCVSVIKVRDPESHIGKFMSDAATSFAVLALSH
jgi:DNA-binding beta-propeller fold protein YncE